jgi:hypothetical protein
MLSLQFGDDAADDTGIKLGISRKLAGDRLQPAASNVIPLAKRQ